ncbi:recombining binding protein suppressor of hairless-like [Oscarella lobularis]|uniref:recombining binding protein suppressor of hairless-like n=1 Tax=Oscarella lobularis TaxID=121494 RepID=UPI00331336AD
MAAALSSMKSSARIWDAANLNLLVRMSYSDGKDIGVFLLRLAKVLLAPSERKMCFKLTNSDLIIRIGSQVAIFDRLGSLKVSPQYLHADGTTLHLFDENEGENIRFLKGVVHYGQTVKLVCTKTGRDLPLMVIRKVEKQ